MEATREIYRNAGHGVGFNGLDR